MTQRKNTSIVKEFKKGSFRRQIILKNLQAGNLQSILQDEFNLFINAGH